MDVETTEEEYELKFSRKPYLKMEEDEMNYRSRPLAVVLVAQKGGSNEETFFVYPFDYIEEKRIQTKLSTVSPPLKMGLGIGGGGGGLSSIFSKDRIPKDSNRPKLHLPIETDHKEPHSMPTSFGFSTAMLASILCVKDACLDHVLELKIDNIRFAGYPKKVSNCTTEHAPKMFGINFLLPPNVDAHVINSFQRLAKKLSIAIDCMQEVNGYLEKEMREMTMVMEELEAEADGRPFGMMKPFEKIRERSSLAQTLVKVFNDVVESGVVQVFVDKFVEVSFCVESRALPYACLPPRSICDLERVVKHIRPYHGLLLLKDVWPNADPNPSVALLLKHCTPEKSIVAMSAATGIPILQVLLIVRHLLLWARAVVIYPLANTNVYTSSTFTKTSLVPPVFMPSEWSEDEISSALSFFNPYKTLHSFIHPEGVLVEQQVRGRLVVHLLRYQLIMQLHRYYYLIEPVTSTEIAEPKLPCPDSLRTIVFESPLITSPINEYICQVTALQLEKESYAKVHTRLNYLMQLIPFLNGEHHVEDLMYRLNESRQLILSVLECYSYVVADFLRPDEISALSIY